MFPGNEPDNLEIIQDFPYEISDEPTVWIPLSDGVRLAARVWRPVVDEPVPTILEYIPYRRRDGRLADDEQIHPYFAGHGFACVRVDIRGSGDSEGLLLDEYLRQEQDDALEIIAWLAAQPWCDGNVGLMGLSWGGFNSLQVAARQPDALKAIIAVGATVDRYNDDVHYKNGCMVNENFGWGSSFMSFQTRPPDPAIVGESWRDIWLERLDNLPFFPEKWLSHQLRDAYWQHGSVCEDYSATKAATLIVTGWGDAYVNAVPRLLENLAAPCHAIAGPWAHQYPHLATPGPAIDFLGEALRWWRHWLKGEETGLDKEPVYRAYMQEGEPPDGFAATVAGRWVATNSWPTTAVSPQPFYLTNQGLSLAAAAAPPQIIHSPVDTGTASGEFIPHCLGPEMPPDQQMDDGRSLVFDSPPLAAPLDMWGDAVLTVALRSDCAAGHLIARLCDLAPNGRSQRVTFGVLNLTHRHGNDRTTPMPIDEPITLQLRLDHVAHRFPKGHKIRLALSTAYWPLINPTIENPTLALAESPASLSLPIYKGNREITLAPPTSPPPANIEQLRPPKNERRVIRDQAQRLSRVEILDDYGRQRFGDNGLVNEGIKRETYEIKWGDPLSNTAVFHWTQKVERDDWQTRTETHTSLHNDARHYYLTARVEAFIENESVWEKDWQVKIGRLP